MMDNHITRFHGLFSPPTESEDNGQDTDDAYNRGKSACSDGGDWTIVGNGRNKLKQKTYSKRKVSSDGERTTTSTSPQTVQDFKKPRPALISSPITHKQCSSNTQVCVCVCGKVPEDDYKIVCSKCEKSFHADCVRLSGLTPEHLKLLRNWWCFACLNSKFVLNDPDAHKAIRRIVRDELRNVREDILEVKEDIAAVTKSVQTEVKKEVKTYADVIKNNQKEVIAAARGPELVRDVCKSLSMEQLERQRKIRNVVVSNIPEAPANVVGEKRIDHDIQYLCSDAIKMNQSDITTCFRAGKVRKDDKGAVIPRPLVVAMRKPEIAHFWHNGGKGFKCGSHWINEDLCQVDREAKFFAREERRKRLAEKMKTIQQKNQDSRV